MNTKLILLAISVAAFSSCSTLYQSGQTPDDVYFSPARPAYGDDQAKQVQREEEPNNANNNYANNYSFEDRTIRIGIYDRRFRSFDMNYGYDSYNNYDYNSFNHGYNSYNYGFNPYNYGYDSYSYGYYFNPYFYPYPVYSPVYIVPSNPKNTTPRIGNLKGYNPVYNNSSATSTPGRVRPARSFNNSNNNNNSGSAVGNAIRKVFTPAPDNNSNNNSTKYNNTNNSNNNNNSSSSNTRTYTPASSSSSSSSSGSSSSGSGGVTRQPRNSGN